jgi:hypothetical protein
MSPHGDIIKVARQLFVYLGVQMVSPKDDIAF